jgi:hypothetical protein
MAASLLALFISFEGGYPPAPSRIGPCVRLGRPIFRAFPAVACADGAADSEPNVLDGFPPMPLAFVFLAKSKLLLCKGSSLQEESNTQRKETIRYGYQHHPED